MTVILVVIILVAIGVWIYKDAQSRGEAQPGLWAIAAMLLAIVIVPIWLIKRPEKLVSRSPPGSFGNVGSGISAADEIKKLKALRDDGTLTEDEFQRKKNQWLNV